MADESNEQLLAWLRYTLNWLDKETLAEFKRDPDGAQIFAAASGPVGSPEPGAAP